jgi:hypothetical protein
MNSSPWPLSISALRLVVTSRLSGLCYSVVTNSPTYSYSDLYSIHLHLSPCINFFHRFGIEAMSVTTTDNPATTSLRQTLGDYEVHLTGDNEGTGEIAAPNVSNTASTSGNPPGWPQDHHRVPNYRAIDRNLNAAERPNGSNGVERVFITVMFTGVALNAVSYIKLSTGVFTCILIE